MLGDLDCSNQDDDVEGCPADEEGEDDDEYELNGAAPLPQAGGHDANGDADVAVHHHDQRNQEEDHKLLVVTDQAPVLHGVLRVP